MSKRKEILGMFTLNSGNKDGRGYLGKPSGLEEGVVDRKRRGGVEFGGGRKGKEYGFPTSSLEAEILNN